MKTIKKTGILLALLSLIPMLETGAKNIIPSNEKQKNREAQKIALISTKLELTPDEAQKFWPVYNEYESKKKQLNENFRNNREKKKHEEMSTAEIDNLMMAQIEFEQKKLDLKKEYVSKFKTVLPTEKVARLYMIENRFHSKQKQAMHKKQK
jgi:hypothetical protein